jgi:hypothetical protein
VVAGFGVGRRKLASAPIVRSSLSALLGMMKLLKLNDPAAKMNDEFKTLKKFDAGNSRDGFLHSLPALEAQGTDLATAVSIRIVLGIRPAKLRWEKKNSPKDVETGGWNAVAG